MDFIKNKIRKPYQSIYFPFIIFFFGILIIHFFIVLGTADDAWFFKTITHTDKSSYLISRYKGWTSRIFIEYATVTLVTHELVWRILDTLIMVLTIFSIYRIFLLDKCVRNNWIIVSLSLMVPFSIYGEAGWMSTTINYSWTFALGLFSMISIRKILFNEKIIWYEYIFYMIALILGANHEQMCAIVLVVYSVFTVYQLINKKVNWFLIIQTVICVISLVYTVTNSGNAARRVISVKTSFPDFDNISLIHKIDMGFSSALFEFIMKPNIIFTIFCALLLICVIINQRSKFYRWVGAIPFISSLLFGLLSGFLGTIFPGILKIKNSLTQYGTQITCFNVKTWIPDIILTIIIITICFSIYIVFENKKLSLLLIFILSLGFGSRVIMGFSPTIWVSGNRTCFIMYFSFVISSLLLYKFIIESKINRYSLLCTNVINLIGCIAYVNLLCLYF